MKALIIRRKLSQQKILEAEYQYSDLFHQGVFGTLPMNLEMWFKYAELIFNLSRLGNGN